MALRGWGNPCDGIGLIWNSIARNKRLITSHPWCTEGQTLVQRVVEHAHAAIFSTRRQTSCK